MSERACAPVRAHMILCAVRPTLTSPVAVLGRLLTQASIPGTVAPLVTNRRPSSLPYHLPPTYMHNIFFPSTRHRDTAGVRYRDTAGVRYRDTAGVRYRDTAAVRYRDTAGVRYRDTAGVRYRDTAGVRYRDTAGVRYRDTAGVIYRDTAGVTGEQFLL